ncbi:MAG: hypothetical protein AB2A00_32810 [Myxococcota bacterium]
MARVLPVKAAGTLALAITLALTAQDVWAKPRKKPARPAQKAAPVAAESAAPAAPSEDEELSTAVQFEQLKNGGVIWGVNRPGPMTAVAVVVRAGARQEDLAQSGVALAVARWVLEPAVTGYLTRFGVTVELEMLPGGAAFILRGPSERMQAAVAQFLKDLARPNPAGLPRSRVRATLEPRRHDALRSLPDAVAGVCWTGSPFELPAWGATDTLGMVDDRAQREFHAAWYRTRGMTLVVAGPRGGRDYGPLLAALSRAPMSRETIAPGQPGLPVHQVQRGQLPITVAGVAMPGPQNAGGALLVRARTAELLAEEMERGTLAGPWHTDIVWTASNAVVFAAVHHSSATTEQALTEEQAAQLKVLEGAIQGATQLSDEEINALRKREGARLSRRFASPEGAVRLLAPFATVTDRPVDLRKSVMATPTPDVRKLLEGARGENVRLSIRRLPQTGT